MRVRFEQVASEREEEAVIRAVNKTADVQMAIDLLENGSGTIPVLKDGSTMLVRIQAIYYAESVDKKTFIYTKEGCYETKSRLYELEEELDQFFIRCSKAMIINLRKIRSVKNDIGGRMSATLLNGEIVVISRSYVKELKERLERIF